LADLILHRCLCVLTVQAAARKTNKAPKKAAAKKNNKAKRKF
jgi:hypothetical protein